jgi:ribonuclease HI
MPRKQVTIFTDGACLGNPGPGGYGVVLLHGTNRRELSGGFRLTTNNRMEMTAVIVGLETLNQPCDVDVHSDSEYVVHALERGWAVRWRERGWRLGDKRPAANVDLWEKLLALREVHHVKLHWVRGHAGHVENERCDELATAAARQPGLPPDPGYEQSVGRGLSH